MKQGRKLATTKKDLAERLGTATTTREGSGKLLQDLIELKARYENFGLYPELTEAARLWDGKSEPDPIAQAMGLTDAENERLAAEAGMSREEWEEAQRVAEAKREAEKATGSLFGDGGSFSLTEAKERGLFDENGVLKAGNAVVVEPAAFTSFSEFALHASPVDHDGFDTKYIGSGEGHKAFGWGVYAAESPDVNEVYKSQFSKPRFVEPKIFGVRIDTLDMKSKEGKELIERILPEIRFSDPRNPFNRWNGSELEEEDKQQLRDTVAEVITDARKLVNEGKADLYWQAFSLLRNQKKYPYFGNIEGALEKLIKTTAKEGGYTNYKVEILVEKDEMLLWDEPVPPKMRRKLMPLVKEARKKAREFLKEVRKNPNIHNVSESECERLLDELNDASLFESGERLYWKISEALGSDKETSLGMDRLGVHAIKYLDGNSRKGKTKEKTNNYVVFDGDRVKITHKATEESNYEWREVDWKPRAQNENGTGGASMSVVIPRRSICRTRQEALATVGDRGGSLILENRFLNLKAVFNSKSKGKFAHKDSLGRTFEALQPSGMSDEDIKTAHFSAYGNIVELFANAERMKYERAYKDKEVRKGFLHVYSPFELEGMGERFEANIELMIFKEKGKAPMAYLLNVSLASASGQKGRGAGFPNLPIYLSGEIKSDFPDIVKQEKEKNSGGSFSVIGPHARTWDKHADRAFAGRDDGKMRAEIDSSQARLKVAWQRYSKDDLLKLRDERATPEEKKKLDEYRKVSDDWVEAIDGDPEKLSELDKRLEELWKELTGLADRVLDELGYDFKNDMAIKGARDAVLFGYAHELWKYDTSGDNKSRKLGDILDYPELFDAYPELAVMKVKRGGLVNRVAWGEYSPLERSIALNETLPPEDARSVLLHEIQHAIQDIEGFARGTSQEEAGLRRKSLLSDARGRLYKYGTRLSALAALPEDVKGLRLDRKAGREEFEKRRKEASRAAFDIIYENSEKRKKGEELTAEEEAAEKKARAIDDAYIALDRLSYEELGSTARAIEKTLKKRIKQARAFLKLSGLSDYELYQRAAGEIESRNVERRRNWTAEQRRETHFNDTLEYPGEAVNFGSFSVTEAKEKKLFDENGIMYAANGILIDGTSFSFTMMHASPHWIRDKFRLDKIGTGEGAQMFGHGMYFTESDRVNDKYLEQFEGRTRDAWLVNGKTVHHKDLDSLVPGLTLGYNDRIFYEKDPLKAAREIEKDFQKRLKDKRWKYALFLESETSAEAQERFEREIAKYTEREKEMWRGRRKEDLKYEIANWERAIAEWEGHLSNTKKMREWLEAGNTVEFREGTVIPSYNYLVEIDAEEGELFYWDVAMSDESNAGALERMLNSPVKEVQRLANELHSKTYATGEEVYTSLTELMREKHGLGESRADKALAQRYASEALLASGIKGHKYADGFTRNKPRSKWKYNSVIWDMDSLRITHTARGNRDWKPRAQNEGGVGGASMSVCGQRAKGWGLAESRGQVYLDRDGKRKFVIPTRDASFREPLTRGMMNVPEGVRVVAPEVYAEDGKEARAFAREVYRKLQEETAGGKLLEMPDGRRAKVSRRGLSEVQHHSADRRVLAALCALRDLCRQSIYINSAANTQPEKKGKKGIVRFHYYIAKGNFVGATATDERVQDEAYVNIVLSEYENGDLFYDLDATNVEDVNKNEGVSATLPEARLPRTGEQEGEAPYVGRIQQTKQFVNYVNKKIKEEGSGNHGSFSVIGPHAKTWDKHADRAFAGRDDGKMRAEIDSSQARVKGAWMRPEDADRLLGRMLKGDGQREALVELRGAWDRYRQLVHKRSRTEEEEAELRSLRARANAARKGLEGLAEGRANILVSHLFPLLLTVLLTTKSMSALLLKSSLTSPWQHRHNGNDEFLYEQVFPAHCLHDYPVGMHIRFKTGRFTDHP